jgi:hypothetical protein
VIEWALPTSTPTGEAMQQFSTIPPKVSTCLRNIRNNRHYVIVDSMACAGTNKPHAWFLTFGFPRATVQALKYRNVLRLQA